MSSIDPAVAEKYKSDSYEKTVIVTFPDLDYTVPSENVYWESLDLRESILDSDSFEAVGCIASSLSISIRAFDEEIKGEKIQVSIYIDGNQTNAIPLFTGFVDEVALEANKQVRKITAYDQLYSIQDKDVADWYNGITFPVTLADVRTSLCTYLGITVAQNYTLVNDSVSIYKQFNLSSLKGLDVLKQICQINAVFGIMNRHGQFEFRSINTSAVNREVVDDYRSLEYQEFMINPLDRISIKDSENSTSVSYGIGENKYIVQGNMFTYNLDAATKYSVARNIYLQLANVTYHPFTAVNNGLPWIEVGDNCQVSYTVYDFDEATSESDAYTQVTMTVFNRQLKGIQNLVDTYSIGGVQDQHEFVTSIGGDMNYIEAQIEEMTRAASTEFAYYRNLAIISGSAGTWFLISDIAYSSNPGQIITFSSEISMAVNGSSTLYALEDPIIEVKYVLNGTELPYNHSKGIISEGFHILTLVQFWISGNATENRLQVYAKTTGCSVSIPQNRIHSYITIKDGELKESELEITHEPNKVQYFVQEPIDFTGLIVSKVIQGESTKQDVTSSCVFSPIEGTSFNDGQLVTVDVSYSELDETGETITYTAEFSLEILDIIPTAIRVTTLPNKRSYKVGENFNYSGIVVTATYNDGSTANVTNQCVFYPVSGSEAQDPGKNTIDVSYTAAGETVDTSFSLTVVGLRRISVTTLPNKTIYSVGELFNYQGIVITATLTDGTTEDVTSLCTFSPSSGSTAQDAGTETIDVSCTKYMSTEDTSFNVTVYGEAILVAGNVFSERIDEKREVRYLTRVTSV